MSQRGQLHAIKVVWVRIGLSLLPGRLTGYGWERRTCRTEDGLRSESEPHVEIGLKKTYSNSN